MTATLLRQWSTLKRIRRGQRTGTEELRRHLESEGLQVGLRTIQRDLTQLAELFPALKSDGSKPAGWYWEADAEVVDIPGLSPSMALSFKLVESYLKPMLPPVVGVHLQPYFDSARRILEGLDEQGFAQWNKRIRIMPRAQALLPARVDTAVAEAIYESLFLGKRFSARYTPRAKETAQYEFSPLALIFRENVVYLVATLWDYSDPRQFALHRFSHVEILDQSAAPRADFDLDAYLGAGSFDYPVGDAEPIRLVVHFDRMTAIHLEETPLSPDQQMSAVPDSEWVEVQATVLDTQQLRWWLLGFGDRVRVMAPETLREEIKTRLEGARALYQAAIEE